MLHRFEEFCGFISAIQHHIQKIERDEMSKYGLKGPYAQYLVAMSHCPEGVTAAQLCQICDRDKAAVSRALAEMERKALVTRDAASETAYRALVTLTNEGKAAAQYVCDRVRLAVEIAGRGISDAERPAFYENLRKITENLRILGEKGLPEYHHS